MPNFILKALTFLRFVDVHDGNLSLTNLALIVVLTKLILAPATSITDIGALFLALANYMGKKVLYKEPILESEESKAMSTEVAGVKEQVEQLKSKVGGLSLAAGLKRLGSDV